jgi:protein subunit release factor A
MRHVVASAGRRASVLSMKERIISLSKSDFEVEAFYAGGPGGQNQNKRKTGCRVRHPDSGAVAEARDSRSFDQNRKAAFRRMIETTKFQTWLKAQINAKLNLFNDIEQVTDIIRTYHFKRDTVIDHRTGETTGLSTFLDGER